MNKAVQEAGQRRDGPVQAEEAAVPLKPWTPRTDGKVLLQVSERTTAFVAPTAPLPPTADQVERIDPAVMGEVPTSWTWDLVHCRLQVVAASAQRLPDVKLPGGLRSFLGALQPQSSRFIRPLSPAEVTQLDWTWLRISAHSEVDRAVLMGVMFGLKLSTIVKITTQLAAQGIGVDRPIRSKTAVHRRYRTLTTAMAKAWNDRLREPIDRHTREAWIARMEKAIK